MPVDTPHLAAALVMKLPKSRAECPLRVAAHVPVADSEQVDVRLRRVSVM